MNAPVDQQMIMASMPGRIRPRRRLFCYLAAVGLPTLLVFVYLQFIASPQYITEFRFSVYNATDPGSNVFSEITNTVQSGASIRSDHIVADYLRSRQVVEDLRKKVNLPALFNPPGFDPLFHFWWDNGTVERLHRYWRNWAVDAEFDVTTQLGYVGVRAFSAQDSLKITLAMAEAAEQVVNDVGSKSRNDAVRYAETEYQNLSARLAAADEALRAFREENHTITPTKPGDAAEALSATLRQNLTTLNAQLNNLGQVLSPTAPAVLSLKAQIAGTEAELTRVSNGLGRTGLTEGGLQRNLSKELVQFDVLERERNFTLAARDGAYRHLEQVKFNASIQHLYLQQHVKPSLAQSAVYPRPFRWTLMTFGILTVCWMIGVLLYYSIREHAA